MPFEMVARANSPRAAPETRALRSELRVLFPSTPLAVRDALRSTMGGLRHLDLTEDEASAVELVLAEVMNNVVEHAYEGGDEGMIELHVVAGPGGLACTIQDGGAPLPGGLPSAQDCPGPAGSLPAHPEGGFGWFLIHQLAEDLAYTRLGTRNSLSFRMRVGRHVRAN